MKTTFKDQTKCTGFRWSLHLYSVLTLLLFSLLLNGCGKDVSKGRTNFQAQQNIGAVVLGVIDFAEKYSIPYRGMSASQLDTLCVNLTGLNIPDVQTQMDDHAAFIGSVSPEIFNWYEEYRLNDQDFSGHCLGAFPQTFTSVRTGQTHTVNNYTECRQVTSDLVSAQYIQYLQNGGQPALIAAKVKASGCMGSAVPFNARLQSVHGSMIDDYRGMGGVYP